MPQYFFTVRADTNDTQESAADLRDDAAAFAYALDLVRAAQAGALGGSLVKVRDETRPIVFSIPSFRRAPDWRLRPTPRDRERGSPDGSVGRRSRQNCGLGE
jgi:hypothetical protein